MAKILFALLTIALIGYDQCQGSTTSRTTLKSTTMPKSTSTTSPTTTVDPLVRFKNVFDDLKRVCTLKDRNDDCYDEEDALTLRVNRGFDDACDYRRVYTVCMSIRCESKLVLTDVIRDLNDLCDDYGATTTTIDGTTTTAAPVAPKDQLAKIIVGIDCKYACDTEKRAVYDEIMKTGNNKVACSKLRPYTDCLRNECATPVADTIISSMKDLCYDDASPPARGLSGLMLKLSANLYLQ